MQANPFQQARRREKRKINILKRDLAVLRRGQTPLESPSRTRVYPSLKPPRRYTIRGLGKRNARRRSNGNQHNLHHS